LTGAITEAKVPLRQPPAAFEDIADHEARKDIAYLSNKGYVQGTTETQFQPGKTTSRESLLPFSFGRRDSKQMRTYAGIIPSIGS